ncbi:MULTISPECIES: restriction endonuclease subunit S [unclassified Acinetobacter]|uniref:restriction endonuclease subunit S n=1 Tax=unclassified Acinetobacter TaxID=196816 RepID=UPI0015D23DC3|nr:MULTISPECIES: restriction endonuclease subunit S [unclassified Acinetobacter]
MAKYQKYTEYKDSGVEWLGEIPSHWKVVKLSYKLRLLSGDGITAFDIEDTGTYPVFGGNGLRGFTEKYNCDGEYALVGRQGALCGNINVARGKFFATEHAVVVYPYEKFNLTYLSEFLRFMDLGQYSVSAAQPGIAVDRINALPIVIPTLDEQNSIGDFLDHETAKIDHLIEKQQQLIELLKEKRQAVISHAVTKGLNPNVPMKDSGVEWLGEVPEHWGIVRLKHLILGNLVYGANEAAEDDNPNNPRYIRITDMNNDGSLDPNTFRSLPHHIAENYLLEDGDILLARSGATVGKSFLFKDEFGTSCFAGYLIRARSDKKKLNPKFAYWFFQSESYWKYVSGSQIQATIQNVSAEKYGDLYLSVPEILVQEQISNFLECEINKIDNLIAKAESAIQLMQERRTALISAAVTGKIDVRHWQSPTVAETQTELSA